VVIDTRLLSPCYDRVYTKMRRLHLFWLGELADLHLNMFPNLESLVLHNAAARPQPVDGDHTFALDQLFELAPNLKTLDVSGLRPTFRIGANYDSVLGGLKKFRMTRIRVSETYLVALFGILPPTLTKICIELIDLPSHSLCVEAVSKFQQLTSLMMPSFTREVCAHDQCMGDCE